MNKPIYLGLSILKLSKKLMYDFWYNYVKSKYGKKAKLCYMDTDSCIVYIKAEDTKTENQLGGEIMTKFVGLREKPEHKKAKGTIKCVIKRKLRFENYENSLEATQLENKINYLEIKINIDSFKKSHEQFIKSNNKSNKII